MTLTHTLTHTSTASATARTRTLPAQQTAWTRKRKHGVYGCIFGGGVVGAAVNKLTQKKCVNKATPTPRMRRYPSDFLDQSQGTGASFDKKPKLSLGRCNHVTSSTV